MTVPNSDPLASEAFRLRIDQTSARTVTLLPAKQTAGLHDGERGDHCSIRRCEFTCSTRYSDKMSPNRVPSADFPTRQSE